MKYKLEIMVAGVMAVLCAGVAFAQSTDYTIRQIRDPVQLQEKVNSDMTTIKSRLCAVESSNLQTTASAVTVGALSTTGTVTIAEGALTDSKIVSADIKDGEIVNADINASAAITGGKLNLTSGTTAVTASGLVKGGTLGIGSGVLARVAGTLVWIEGGITNSLDPDVTTP